MIHIHSQTVKNHSDYKHLTFLFAVINFFRLNLGLSYKLFYNVTFNISILNHIYTDILTRKQQTM